MAAQLSTNKMVNLRKLSEKQRAAYYKDLSKLEDAINDAMCEMEKAPQLMRECSNRHVSAIEQFLNRHYTGYTLTQQKAVILPFPQSMPEITGELVQYFGIRLADGTQLDENSFSPDQREMLHDIRDSYQQKIEGIMEEWETLRQSYDIFYENLAKLTIVEPLLRIKGAQTALLYVSFHDELEYSEVFFDYDAANPYSELPGGIKKTGIIPDKKTMQHMIRRGYKSGKDVYAISHPSRIVRPEDMLEAALSEIMEERTEYVCWNSACHAMDTCQEKIAGISQRTRSLAEHLGESHSARQEDHIRNQSSNPFDSVDGTSFQRMQYALAVETLKNRKPDVLN